MLRAITGDRRPGLGRLTKLGSSLSRRDEARAKTVLQDGEALLGAIDDALVHRAFSHEIETRDIGSVGAVSFSDSSVEGRSGGVQVKARGQKGESR